MLIKTDSNGDIVWHKFFDEFAQFTHLDVNEDGIIVGGFTWHPENGAGTNLALLMTDHEGNELWRYQYGNDALDQRVNPVQFMDDSRILSIGGVHALEFGWIDFMIRVQVLDYSVTNPPYVVDSYDIFPAEDTFGPFSLIDVSDGGLLMSGVGRDENAVEDPTQHGMVIKFDNEGDSLWGRYYNHTADGFSNWLNDAVELPDGGFALTGTSENGFGLYQIWLLRLDSLGCLEPGCHLITDLEEQYTDLMGSLSIFPNPLQIGKALNISFQPKVEGDMHYQDESTVLRMYDMTGRVLHEEVLPPTGSSDGFIHRMDIPQLASGQYILQWMGTEGQWYDGQGVVME